VFPVRYELNLYMLCIKIINFVASKVRRVLKADKLTAIYEPIV
jgi:hypothetical protein